MVNIIDVSPLVSASSEVVSDVDIPEGPNYYTLIRAFDTVGAGSDTSSDTERLTAPSRTGEGYVSMLASAMRLPLPEDITQEFVQDWSTNDENSFGAIIGTAADAIRNGGSGFLSDLKATAGNEIVSKFAQSFLKSQTQRQTGTAHNPYTEILYDGPGFRTFSFTWKLYPKGPGESNAIRTFLESVKTHMHPSFVSDSTRAAFKLPSTFEVQFMGTKIPRMTTLALTALNVNYTEQGVKFYNDGSPAFMSVTMNFSEMDVLTKETISELAVA